MTELLKEVPVLDTSKEILIEKHSDKTSVCPCNSNDKECLTRWIQAVSDCD